MSTPCGPKRHVYWVNSGGPGVAQNTKCVRGYCERVTAQCIFSSSYFQDKVDNLLENYYAALESESCMDRSDVLMWRNMSPIQCQPPDTDQQEPFSVLSSRVFVCFASLGPTSNCILESYNLFRFMFQENESHSPWTLIYWCGWFHYFHNN